MNRITLYVNRHQQKADGTCAIYVATVLNGQPVRFHTGVCAPLEAIDFAKGGIRGHAASVRDKNLIISNCKARVSNIFVAHRLRFSELTPELLRKEYEHYQSNYLFYDYAMKKLNDYKLNITKSTHKRHVTVLNQIRRFSPQLRLSEITETTLQEFVRWCRVTCQNQMSTVVKNVKVMGYYYRLAAREGLVSGNPFEGLRIRPNQSVIEYLNPEELQNFIALYKSNKLAAPLQNVLQYFLFSCFTGLRYSDVQAFSHSNIVGSTIVVQMIKTRNETGKTVKIPLTKGVEQLIRDAGTRVGEKIFRVISNQKTNIFMRQINAAAGVSKRITFHCARHTFATNFLAKNRGDIATLQELLGHAKIEQTRIYAHIIYEDTAASMQFFNAMW